MKMKNDFDEDSLLAAVNDLKIGLKSAEDTLNIRRIIGNSQNELRDPYKCSAVLDFSMVSAAFQYYKYQKNETIPLDTSNSSSDMWTNSYTQIKEIDCTQSFDSSNNLEKSLSTLQMDTDFISEWSKFNPDFLNLYSFFSEQIDIPSNTPTIQKNKMNENEFENLTIVNFEMNNSNLKEHSKSLDSNSSESNPPLETSNENFEMKSVISKYSVSSNHHSANTGKEKLILQCFHDEGYFPEELDYEPSDTGDEAKESDSEFSIHNILKDEGNGNFSNYCPQVAVSENSTFQEKIHEVDRPEHYTEVCGDQNFISFLQNDFESVPDKSRLENNYEKSFEYDDDDESESDNDHSFKRNSSRNRQVIDQETIHQPLINSDISKVRQLDSINEVILYIYEQCKSGNINEAITMANKYIAISEEAVQLEIFKELFINTINLIKSSVLPVDNIMISKSLGEIMKIFHQLKLFDSHLCSFIVSECFGCDHTIKIGVKFFSFIQKIKVPVHSDAISSYIDTIMPDEIPSLELILFMEYVKWVCNLPCPKALLCKALGHFSKQEESSFLVGFVRLCKFLCSVTSLEVDVNYLQNFIEFCIKNDCWTQIASFFQAWYKDGHLISCLACSFLFQPEDVGIFYEKLTEEIYKCEDVSLYLVGILGQMGVSLMLEVSSKKHYKSAFQILFVLHKRNINYLELQACLYNAPSYMKNLLEFVDVFVFPFTVAFAALDICLHLKRFKDAYHIFKSFSLNLPENMEDKMKLKVRSRRFGYLLKLTQELYSIEPLNLGLQAFHEICLAAKDFSLEEFEDFTEEIQVIYNKYLAYVINGCQLHTALELFEHSEGPLKKIFILYPQVLRGLLVTFAQNDKMEEAYKFFSLGCTRKVYNVEQTKIEECVWCLIIMSSWTFFEVEFIIKTFIKDVSSAWNNKQEIDFGMQLSVQILFEESQEDCLEIGCLKKSYTIDSAKEMTCNILKSLDTNIKWAETQNPICLELVPETIYNYWINTSPNFLWMKNSRKNLLEDTRQKAEFKIQLSEEDLGYKYSTKSNSVKSLNKVLGQLTPEYSVADSSHHLISDKTCDLSPTPKQTLPETDHRESPETTTLENTHQQIFSLDVLSTEQEQIISSSNQLSPKVHSSTTTLEGEVSKIDSSENISTSSENTNQRILGKKCRRICNNIKVFKSSYRPMLKNSVSKTIKYRKRCKRVYSKKCKKSHNATVSKKVAILPPETALRNIEQSLPKTKISFQKCFSKPWRVNNFQVSLKNLEQDGGSRSVMHTSQVELAEAKNIKNDSNVPDAVFQKIVSFLQSKVLLKCKDLLPQQQEEKVNHLATLFIQSNVVGGLDKKTMKLLNEFAEGRI